MFSSGKIHLNLRCLPCTRGPYLVLSKNPKYFLVQIGSKSDSVSVDQLKPVFSDQLVTSQQPPRRGRPSSAPAPLSPSPLIPATLTPAPLTPAPLTPALLTLAPLTPALLTPALLTLAPLTPTSSIPLQRAQGIKKKNRFSPQQP